MNEEYKKRPKVHKLQPVIPVLIPDNVLEQIKFLCNEIHHVEWSGVLFYDTVGEIDKIGDFTIELKYIYLMHKGSSGATKYDYNEEIVAFRMDNPESLKWKIGHIHSHHRMDTFFSGTDEDEMALNSEFHNYYLSIVVNNKLEITGRVGFRGRDMDHIYECRRGNGSIYKLATNINDDVMFLYDIAIDKEIPKSINNVFVKRLVEIKHKKEVEDKNEKELKERQERVWKRNKQLKKEKEKGKKVFPPGKQLGAWEWGEETNSDFDEDQFASFWILFGELGSEGVDFDDAIEQLNAKFTTEQDVTQYVNDLIGNSVELFTRYYIGYHQHDIITEFGELYEELEIRSSKYPFLVDMMSGIAVFLEELEKQKGEVHGS